MRSALSGLLFWTVTPTFSQVLDKGDIALLGLNANAACNAGYLAGDDQISFVCFKTILTGFTIDLTDNGYERCNAGQWGDSEGAVRMTRTGGAIPAGTVITWRFVAGGVGPANIVAVTPAGGWACSYSPGFSAGNLNLNQGGDQLFFLQGGTWTNPGLAHDATYTGVSSKVICAFTTNNSWSAVCAGATAPNQNSNLPPGIDCFATGPTSVTDFAKYIGPLTNDTQRGWLNKIDTPGNWASYPSCAGYNAGGTNYTAGLTIPFVAGFYPGYWRGTFSADWFDCRNWDDAEVPLPTTPVLINPLYASQSCVIGINLTPPTAFCASLLIQSAGTVRTLTIQNGGVLQVGGAVTADNTSPLLGQLFSGVILGNGVTNGNLTATGLVLSGGAINKGGFRSEQSGNTVAIAGNVTVNSGGYLDLQGGVTGGTLSLTGNYSNNDAETAFDETGSNMIFNGAGPQSINTSGFQDQFAILTLNKSGNDLTLNAPILVKSTLTLTSGRVMTSNPTGLLTLSNTGTYSALNPASFVHGPMVKIGPVVGFQFPIGKANYVHGIALSSITASATDAFIAEYFLADPHTNVGVPIETPPLYEVSSCEYWKLDQYAGTPTGKVTLGWNTSTNCGILVPSSINVAHWDGAMWRDRGGPGLGSPTLGSVTTDNVETIFAPGGFWTFATLTNENPLPIELLSFGARPEGSQVRLDWVTATERDNDYFTIERSGNGQDFEEVTRVDGAGNSVTNLTYMDYDRWPLPGTSFYRLRQTDFDGQTSVSNMVPVSFSGKGDNGLVVLNDVDQVIGVHDFAVGGTVEVLDMTGRVIWKGRVESEGRSYIPTTTLGSGAYVLRVSDANRSESAPFVR